MISSVTRNAYLRPTRSPMRPKNSAPNGRTTKPTANVERYAISASVSLPCGIEQRRDDRGQAAEDVEVVPLDHRADGGRSDDLADAESPRRTPHASRHRVVPTARASDRRAARGVVENTPRIRLGPVEQDVRCTRPMSRSALSADSVTSTYAASREGDSRRYQRQPAGDQLRDLDARGIRPLRWAIR